MMRVERKVYTDAEGRYTKFENCTMFENIEDARAYAKEKIENTKETMFTTNEYRIVKVTMDEETFTMTEEVVEDNKTVKAIARAKADIERYNEEIARIEESKKRCKTEKGIEKKNKEIAFWEERKAIANKIIERVA